MAEEKRVRMTGEQLIEAYRNGEARLGVMQAQLRKLQRDLTEILMGVEAIKELQNAKENESALIAIGGGYFAEAKIADRKRVKGGLAGGTLIERSAAAALKELEVRRKKAEQDTARQMIAVQKMGEELNNISKVLQTMSKIAERERGKREQQPGSPNVGSVS